MVHWFSVKCYFQLRSQSEVFSIVHFHYGTKRIWTHSLPKSRHFWMKLLIMDCTGLSKYKKSESVTTRTLMILVNSHVFFLWFFQIFKFFGELAITFLFFLKFIFIFENLGNLICLPYSSENVNYFANWSIK